MGDYLYVDTGAVVNAGQRTAGTADDWSTWGDRIRTVFDTTRDELHNARIRHRLESYSSQVERGARYVGLNVETVGTNAASAGNAVNNADTEAEGAINQHGRSTDSGALQRPINAGGGHLPV